MILTVAQGESFEQRLRDVFTDAGWRLRSRPDDGVDLIAQAGPLRYAVQVSHVNEARRSLLEGPLASAILRARVGAQVADARPLAIIAAPAISDLRLKELDEFVRRFGDGAAWGAIDDSGLVVMHGEGLDSIRRERSFVTRPPVVQRADMFSDLGQWMLKVLLSHRLPPELRFTSPRDQRRIDAPIVNARSLAVVAGVSVPSAYRFVAALRGDGYLVERAPTLRLMRMDELLDRWRAVYKRRSTEVHARWVFVPLDASRHVDDVLRAHSPKADERVCLGLFAACARLGFPFVRGVASHLLLERISPALLRDLGVRYGDPGEPADVIIQEPRFPETVFRGAAAHDGVRVADVLQCWLDVTSNPARGEEMAEHLFDRVLRPWLLASDR